MLFTAVCDSVHTSGLCGRGHAWQGCVCGRGHAWQGGHVWRGACVEGGSLHVWGACMAGGMCSGGGGMCGGSACVGDVWWEGCVCAGETAIEVGGTHPTRMYSCFTICFFNICTSEIIHKLSVIS